MQFTITFDAEMLNEEFVAEISCAAGGVLVMLRVVRPGEACEGEVDREIEGVREYRDVFDSEARAQA